MKTSRLFILCLAAVSFLFIAGCDNAGSGDNENEKGFDTFVSLYNGNVIVPVVNVLESSESGFRIESVYISKSTSTYVRGVIKVTYTGTDARDSVKMDYSLKNQNDEEIYTDYTYLDKPNVAWNGYSNTSCFVTSTYNTGYFTFIEQLSDYNAVIGDIKKLDVAFSSYPFTYESAKGNISLVGDRSYEDLYCNQDIKNDSSVDVTDLS